MKASKIYSIAKRKIGIFI